MVSRELGLYGELEQELLNTLEKAGGLANDVALAYQRVKHAVLHTPLLESPWLAKETSAGQVWLKLESEQHTGSFKCRGALNKMMTCPAEQLQRGVITASSGNHALAMMYAARYIRSRSELQLPDPVVYVPCTVSLNKLRRLQQQPGARVIQAGQDCVEAELAAAEEATKTGALYVSPYNDLQVMAGQGTLGVEVLLDVATSINAVQEQQPQQQQQQVQQVVSATASCWPDVVIVPVGGGGLISGVAAAIKAVSPHTHIVGCSPAASSVMAASVTAGKIVELESKSTLSDGTAGGIEPGALTLSPCMQFVDEWVLLEEREIALAMQGMLDWHSKLIEGAAGCAVAACKRLGRQGKLHHKKVVVVVCGGNVSTNTLLYVLRRDY